MVENVAFKLFIGSSWLAIVSFITWVLAIAIGI